jgi:hypothetical protein
MDVFTMAKVGYFDQWQSCLMEKNKPALGRKTCLAAFTLSRNFTFDTLFSTDPEVS